MYDKEKILKMGLKESTFKFLSEYFYDEDGIIDENLLIDEILHKIEFLGENLNFCPRKCINLFEKNPFIIIDFDYELLGNIQWLNSIFDNINYFELLTKDSRVLTNEVLKMEGVLYILGLEVDNEEDLYRAILKNPSILSLDSQNLIDKLNFFKKVEFDIDKIIESYPVLFSESLESMQNVVDKLKEKGFNNEEIFNMFQKVNNLFSVNLDDIDERQKLLSNVTSFEMSEFLIKRIIYINPTVFLKKEEYIIKFFVTLEKYGFSEKEIVNLCIRHKFDVIRYSDSLFDKKIELIVNYGLKNSFLKRPGKFLKTKFSVVEARLKYFESLGFEITKELISELFNSEKYFIKHYNLSNNMLFNKSREERVEKIKILK